MSHTQLYDPGAADDAEDTDNTRGTELNIRCMEVNNPSKRTSLLYTNPDPFFPSS